MALSPAKKARKSPRLASAKETGSKRSIRLKSGAAESPKSTAKELFHCDFSTPIAAKKVSSPTKILNEPLKYESDQEKPMANNESAVGSNGKFAESNLSTKRSSENNSISPAKASRCPTNFHQLSPQSKDNKCTFKAKSSSKNTSEVMASPKQHRMDDKEVKDKVLRFGLKVDLRENHDLLSGQQSVEEMSSPKGDSKGKSSGLEGVAKRRKSPGVRVLGGRIYDSENGKTCHQCRQKTMELMAHCKNVVGTKACTLNFCPKCLFNRYGEKVENVLNIKEWKCPKCRGRCNCSICMKKQGHMPTGALAQRAKATGFNSVAHLLESDVLTLVKAEAFNDSGVNTLDSVHSGNLEAKGLDRKLKHIKNSMISKEVDETFPSKKHGSMPPVSPSKHCELKISLDKSSAACDGCPSESKGASEIQKKTSKSKSSRSSNAKEFNVHACEDCPSESNDASEVGKKTSKSKSSRSSNTEDVNVHRGSLVRPNVTKSVKNNSKMKGKDKIEEDDAIEGLQKERKMEDAIGNGNEKKPDVMLFSCTRKSANAKIEGNALLKCKYVKDSQSVHTDTEPFQKEQTSELKQKLNKIHAFKVSCDKENVLPEESVHISKVAKSSKKRKQDSTNVSEYKNVIEDSEEKAAVVTDCNTEVTQKHPRRANKKHKPIPEAEEEILLPQGKPLKSVGNIEFSADDVGAALQFLEFCSAFEEALNLTKGQPESVLRELMRGRIGHRGLYSSVVQFHMKLLSLIRDDSGEQYDIKSSGSGENSWLQVLQRHVMENLCFSTEKVYFLSSLDVQLKFGLEASQPDSLTMAALKHGAEGYDKLDYSRKLRLLNFLCNESLGTECLRNWIDSTSTRFNQSKKEHRIEVIAAKEKEREAKQKMKHEIARILLAANDGAPLSIGEHEQLLLRVKLETEKAHAVKVDALKAASRIDKQRHDAVRTDPINWDKSGRAYWRLKGVSNRSVVILQDISNWNLPVGQDRWSIYNEEEENVLNRYIQSLRFQKAGKIQQAQGSSEICSAEIEAPPMHANETSVAEINGNAGVLDSGEADAV